MASPSAPAGAVLCVTVDDTAAGLRLDKALVALVPEEASLSRSRLMRLIAEGAVIRAADGQPVTDPKTKVATGETYAIHPGPEAEIDDRPEDIPLTIVWEDDELIVIDKPVGMVVHPAPGSPSGTLVNALLHHFGAGLSSGGGGAGAARRPGIVHRIDKDTSGLLVAAKTDRAHQALAAQFEAHSVTRHYMAVVHGLPDTADPRLRGVRGVAVEGGGVFRIATQLARHKTDRQRQAVVEAGGRVAVTRFRVVEDLRGVAALVDCWLETGRTHQIRVHMAHAGHGLVGDQTYGGRRRVAAKAVGDAAAGLANAFPRQALHAATLGFDHPDTGERLEFESPLPEDIATLIGALRG